MRDKIGCQIQEYVFKGFSFDVFVNDDVDCKKTKKQIFFQKIKFYTFS